MDFEFEPKCDGAALPMLKTRFNGTKLEAFKRAVALAESLDRLFNNYAKEKRKFSVLVTRRDLQAKPYEVDNTGHTVEYPAP
jgi:hypothetical protein